jgi:poly(A) polymerase
MISPDKTFLSSKNAEAIRLAAELAKLYKQRVFLVGGAVRDLLAGRPVCDLDFTSGMDIFTLASRFAEDIGGRFLILHEKWPAARVILTKVSPRQIFDFTAFKGSDILEDLAARDFTINAMAIDVADFSLDVPAIIDPLGGGEDLKAKLIRVPSRRAFEDDPLRMLRAFRLMAELGFNLDPATSGYVRELAHLISGVSGERVRAEFFAALCGRHAVRAFSEMSDARLLDSFLPELAATRNVAQNRFSTLTAWQHSLKCLEAAIEICANPENFFPKKGKFVLSEIERSLGAEQSRLSLVKLAALLHDVGQPVCLAKNKDGHPTFHQHEEAGRELSDRIASRLKMSNRHRTYLKDMIFMHMRPLALAMDKSHTPKARYRLYRDARHCFADLVVLAAADGAATGPFPGFSGIEAYLPQLTEMLKEFHEEFLPARSNPPLLKGRDLIAAFKVPPGETMGKILRLIENEQTEGKIKSKMEALAVAADFLTRLDIPGPPQTRILVREVADELELAVAYAIRWLVFVKEQSLFGDSDIDEHDAGAHHLVAIRQGRIIGTVRVYREQADSWIGGRLAVLPKSRGFAGARLVKSAVELVKQLGCKRFLASIQEQNVLFFEKLGWKSTHVEKIIRGVNHVIMQADLQK